jgi:hypothetical protein
MVALADADDSILIHIYNKISKVHLGRRLEVETGGRPTICKRDM